MYVLLAIVLALCALAGLGAKRARTLRARAASDSGASALEWAVISAIVVTAAVIIGGIVYNAVQNKGNAISTCANQGPQATQC